MTVSIPKSIHRSMPFPGLGHHRNRPQLLSSIHTALHTNPPRCAAVEQGTIYTRVKHAAKATDCLKTSAAIGNNVRTDECDRALCQYQVNAKSAVVNSKKVDSLKVQI